MNAVNQAVNRILYGSPQLVDHKPVALKRLSTRYDLLTTAMGESSYQLFGITCDDYLNLKRWRLNCILEVLNFHLLFVWHFSLLVLSQSDLRRTIYVRSHKRTDHINLRTSFRFASSSGRLWWYNEIHSNVIHWMCTPHCGVDNQIWIVNLLTS